MAITANRNVTHRPLTAGEPILNPGHAHSLTGITGYAVVSTSFLPGCDIVLTDAELVDGTGSYGRALDIVHDLRKRYAASPYAYAVIAHLYECGCRSDGEVRF